MYNEMVVLKLVQSMTKLIASPPEVFKDQIHEHFRKSGENFHSRIKSWMELSEIDSVRQDNVTLTGESDNSLKLLGSQIFFYFSSQTLKRQPSQIFHSFPLRKDFV